MERRLQEEQEARVRAEEEKRREEDRLKREAEEDQRRERNATSRAAELARLALEHNEAKPGLEAKATRLAELLRAQKEAKDWDNYLACQPRPDAQVEVDMNSFLNSWQLDTATLHLDLPAVTAACESATEVMEDLAFVAANACATNDYSLQMQCARFISRLQELVAEKLNTLTAQVLQYADEFVDVTPTTSNNVNPSPGEVKLASASPNTGRVKLGMWVNLFAKGLSRTKRVEFTELGVNVDLPKAVIAQPLALRVTHWPFDTFSSLSQGSENDVALGGVFLLELLAVSTPPKRARGWLMREIPDERDQLKRLHYPLDGMVASTAIPIKASFTLPNDVLFEATIFDQTAGATIRVGWWDAARMQWKEEGVTDVVYQQDTNTISFSTLHLTHFALLVQRDRNYHKHSWSLCMETRPRRDERTEDFCREAEDNDTGNMRARLILSTAMFAHIQFEITPHGARLIEPALKQLESLRRKTLPPGELLTRLARAGIDLCPPLDTINEGDYEMENSQQSSCVPKMLEDRVIDEIASLVAGFEISDGNDNAGICDIATTHCSGASGDNKRIVFSVKEMSWPYMSSNDEGEQQQTGGDESTSIPLSAASILVLAEIDKEAEGGVKFRLGPNEDSDADQKDDEDIYDTHAHLRQALDEHLSPDARDRLDNSHVLLELTLQKMLRLLRLLSFSQPDLSHLEECISEKDKNASESVTEYHAEEKEGDPDVVALDNAAYNNVETTLAYDVPTQ